MRVPSDVVVERSQEARSWVAAAVACGWHDDDDERPGLEEWCAQLDGRHDFAFWRASVAGVPVGVASGFLGPALEVVSVAVGEAHRRRGLATALVHEVLAWGERRGATEVVAAPSPDGARLLGSLGFVAGPVRPDTCFYLPT